MIGYGLLIAPNCSARLFFASYSFRIVVWIDVRLSSLSIILLVMRTARKLIFLFIHYLFSMRLLGPVGFGPISHQGNCCFSGLYLIDCYTLILTAIFDCRYRIFFSTLLSCKKRADLEGNPPNCCAPSFGTDFAGTAEAGEPPAGRFALCLEFYSY